MRKGWQNLCKPPKSIVKVVVREFYANLNEQMEKVWVPCDRVTINAFYNIPHVDDEEYQKLSVEPNY